MMNINEIQNLTEQTQGKLFQVVSESNDNTILIKNNDEQEFHFDRDGVEEGLKLYNLNKPYFKTHMTYYIRCNNGNFSIVREDEIQEEEDLTFVGYINNIVEKYGLMNFFEGEDMITIQLSKDCVVTSSYNDNTNLITHRTIVDGEFYETTEQWNGETTLLDTILSLGDNDKDIYSVFNKSEKVGVECSCDSSCPKRGTDKCCKTKGEDNEKEDQKEVEDKVEEDKIPEDVLGFVNTYLGEGGFDELLKLSKNGNYIKVRKPDFAQGVRDLREMYDSLTNITSKEFHYDSNRGVVTCVFDGKMIKCEFIEESGKDPYITASIKLDSGEENKVKQCVFLEGSEPTILSNLAKVGSEDSAEKAIKGFFSYALINKLERCS